MATTIEDHLIMHLQNAHALEQMSLQMTKAAAEATDDPAMRQLFEHHHNETEEHERLIRERIEAHGESPSKIKDIGARIAAMGKGTAAMAPSDTPGRLARDGYVQEQTEVASYELLCRVAERAGDRRTVEVGQRILENERATAEKIASSWDHATDLSLSEAGISAQEMAERYLRIYMNDQLAAGVLWREMARRSESANAGTDLGAALARVAAAIAEDVQTFEQIMRQLAIRPSRIKPKLAVAAERLGRLKLNGRLASYSPLSRFEELDFLIMGIQGKKILWANLRDLADTNRSLDGVDFGNLIKRADQQISELEPFWVEARRHAFK